MKSSIKQGLLENIDSAHHEIVKIKNTLEEIHQSEENLSDIRDQANQLLNQAIKNLATLEEIIKSK